MQRFLPFNSPIHSIYLFNHNLLLITPTMSSPILAILRGLRGHQVYAHSTDVHIGDADDQDCFICKEPYNSEEGCRPIRLTECGHVIGQDCFNEWINRYPETCPYWSHHLPLQSVEVKDSNLMVSALLWMCATRWFLFMDETEMLPRSSQYGNCTLACILANIKIGSMFTLVCLALDYALKYTSCGCLLKLAIWALVALSLNRLVFLMLVYAVLFLGLRQKEGPRCLARFHVQ